MQVSREISRWSYINGLWIFELTIEWYFYSMDGPSLLSLCFVTPTSFLFSYVRATETNTTFIICNGSLWQQQIVILMMMKKSANSSFVWDVFHSCWFGTFFVSFCPSFFTNDVDVLFSWRQYFLIFNHEWKNY